MVNKQRIIKTLKILAQLPSCVLFKDMSSQQILQFMFLKLRRKIFYNCLVYPKDNLHHTNEAEATEKADGPTWNVNDIKIDYIWNKTVLVTDQWSQSLLPM